MATPEIAPESASEPSFEQMLELDLPVVESPELPQWALKAIAAIAAIVAFPPDAAFVLLASLVEPLKAYPEGPGKVACRVAMRSKEAEIKAVRAKLASQAGPPAAIERQAIPVITEAPATGAALATVTRETAFVAPTTRGTGETSADSGASVGIFERPASQRVFRVAETQTASQVRSLLGERDFIAGAVAAEGGMLQTSWDGGVRSQTTVAALTDALISIGREADAPGVPSAEAYTGDAVASVSSSRGSISRRLPSRNLADGISAQWQIGYAGIAGEVRAGDSFGSVALVVSLRDDDTLAFDGDLALANAVRSHYATSTAKEILRSDVLTAWLQRLLRRRHGAVKRGRVWYVPSGQAEAVEALIEAIQPLWGDHETIRVTTAKALAKSLSRGLSDELAKVAKDFADATALAKAAARTKAIKKAGEVHQATESYIAVEGEAAFKRATVSSVVAARLLRDLGTVAARVAGYEVAIGSDAVAPCKTEIEALRSALMTLTDDTSARAAMLELE